ACHPRSAAAALGCSTCGEECVHARARLLGLDRLEKQGAFPATDLVEGQRGGGLDRVNHLERRDLIWARLGREQACSREGVGPVCELVTSLACLARPVDDGGVARESNRSI